MARQSIAEIRREEITKAFFKVVSEKGLQKATIREVTEVAGFRFGLLHHYYPNKEAMLLDVLDYVITTYTAEFQKGVSKYDSAIDRLRYFISWLFDIERFDLEFSRAWIEFWVLSKTEPVVSEALKKCYRDAKDIIVGIIRYGIKRGEFKKVNPYDTASMLLGLCEGVCAVLYVVDTEGTPVKRIRKQIADLFLKHLFPEKRIEYKPVRTHILTCPSESDHKSTSYMTSGRDAGK